MFLIQASKPLCHYFLPMFCFLVFKNVFLVFLFLPMAMEVAAHFISLACRDLPFIEFTRKFCGLAAMTALDDATINSLCWFGANYYRPMDLSYTKGLSWREGIVRCLEGVWPEHLSDANVPLTLTGKPNPAQITL